MARPENQYLAESFIPSIIERRDMFVIEQEQIVRSTIRSLIAWRSTVDWVTTRARQRAGRPGQEIFDPEQN